MMNDETKTNQEGNQVKQPERNTLIVFPADSGLSGKIIQRMRRPDLSNGLNDPAVETE
jgi:hypothetical protein